ncbi:unnamed protein product [Cyclocybe aegerita]|uniref:P-loop containing nucleoside triphosphate hydrolase protein n=1 Tax=Cyclocybe aegerita TaxID=1973307 RepID=A0A8S0VTX0_CYCAE|nr:unnamed protein product [Cyclocybe aegerita]
MASPLFLAQQVFSAISNSNLGTPDLSACANDTAGANSTQNATQPLAFPTDVSSLLSFLVSFSALREWLKILVFGSALETLRRLAFHFYYKIYNSFFITAHFEEDDSSYDWMMLWLSQQPTWKSARDVQVSTSSFGLNSTAVKIEGETDENPADVGRQLAYLPSLSAVSSMWYKRRWMRITRSSREGYYGRRENLLEICILSMDHSILNQLLIEAKKAYQAAQENTISIYVSDTSNNWRMVASRPKRPLNSIVLDPGIKDLLIGDARDFLQSKSWYSARGIPFRRGYLLYGAPGSGKTSIIHSLAGELGLDVYVISLSRIGLDDTSLSEIITDLPEKCIALMEDIDAAFSQTLNREPDEDEKEDPEKKKDGAGSNKNNQPPPPSTSRITLSGLLNALDGVAAQEGRILFATTNKYTSLDPALCRPGRMDIHIEFKLASKYQAGELYRCFYLPDSEADTEVSKEKENDKETDQSDVEEKPKGATAIDSGYSSADEKEKDKQAAKAASESTSASKPEPVAFSGESHRRRAPKLSRTQVATLANQFAEAIPEREFSMAALQGYLMGYKIRPYEAISEAQAWIAKESADALTKKASAGPPSQEKVKEVVAKVAKKEESEKVTGVI